MTEPSRVPRVLFVIPGESEGSNMIFARRQLAVLRRLGVPVDSFFLRSRVSPAVLLSERGRFRKQIRAFRPDVVHAQFGTMTAFFAIASSPVPVVITYRGSDLNPAPSVCWIRWATGVLLSQISALRARRIVCVSRELLGRLWWRSAVATVIPSGVDTSIFYPRGRDEARATLGWNSADRVILFSAGSSPKVKRIDLAERVVNVVRRTLPDVRFVVLDGTAAPAEMPLFLNAADCLLITSDYEGSPCIIQEALACNLPIVTVEVGDVRERLEGVSSSSIVQRDPEALGTAVVGALQRRERTNGHAIVQKISFDANALTLLNVYREAVCRS